jgi:hypothetical protein
MEDVFIIDGETADDVRKQLSDALNDMNDKSTDEWSVKNRQDNNHSSQVTPLNPDNNNFAIVVNGCSLVSHGQRMFNCI